MRKWIHVFLIVSMAMMISCGNADTAKLIIASEPAGSDLDYLIFDTEDTFRLRGAFDSVDLALGRHDFLWNNIPHDFIMPKQGALLNIAQQEFVVVAITFEENNTTKEGNGYAPYLRPNFILIDSFLIFNKVFLEKVKDPAYLKNVITNILLAENGNYAPLTEKEQIYDGKDYDTNQKVWGFKKIGARQLFIPKFWDFDPGQEIPEQVTVMRPKNAVGIAEQQFPETKTALLLAEDFLDYAESMPGTYEVLDVSDYLLQMH